MNSKGRMLRCDEVPSLKLPSLPTAVAVPAPRRPLVRSLPQYLLNHEEENSEEYSTVVKFHDIGVNTDLTMHDIEVVEMKTEAKFDKQLFRLENVRDDNKVKFYTGFATFSALMVCFNVLGSTTVRIV